MGVSDFNDMELDAIGEIMNISLGASATAVSTMLGTKVNITTPVVRVLTSDEFEFKSLEPAVGVEIAYTEGLEGSNIMMFRRNDVRIIVGMLMGADIPDEEFEMNEINVSAICEVMNQMMGAASTALSDFLGYPVNISTPQSFALDDFEQFKKEHFPADSGNLVVVRFILGIEDVLKSEFVNVMSVDLARELLAGFEMNFGAPEDTSAPEQTDSQPVQQAAAPSTPAPAPAAPAQESGTTLSQAEIERLLAANRGPEQQSAPAPQPVYVPVPQPVYAPDPKVISAKPVQLPTLDVEERLGKEQADNLEMIMSVPLEISVEIGRTRRKVEDILALSKGSLVVLDKLAGDQVDLFVNGLCVARGDVVVIDDNFGVRITEVLKHAELLNQT